MIRTNFNNFRNRKRTIDRLKNNLNIHSLILSGFLIGFQVKGYSQSVSHAPKERFIGEMLDKTKEFTFDMCQKKMTRFNYFKVEDIEYKPVTLKESIEDSIQKLNVQSVFLTENLNSNKSIIGKITKNMALFPLKKRVFIEEIVRMEDENRVIVDSLATLHLIKQKLANTPNQDQVAYYQINMVGDSRNEFGEAMFWQMNMKYMLDGTIHVTEFNPK